jgi:hypothetical protein
MNNQQTDCPTKTARQKPTVAIRANSLFKLIMGSHVKLYSFCGFTLAFNSAKISPTRQENPSVIGS